MNLSRRWELHVDPDVFKTIKRLPRQDVEAILQVIRLLPANPYFGDIQKMKGERTAWRRRTGAYRIFYKITFSENSILVFRVERRTSKTY